MADLGKHDWARTHPGSVLNSCQRPFVEFEEVGASSPREPGNLPSQLQALAQGLARLPEAVAKKVIEPGQERCWWPSAVLLPVDGRPDVYTEFLGHVTLRQSEVQPAPLKVVT